MTKQNIEETIEIVKEFNAEIKESKEYTYIKETALAWLHEQVSACLALHQGTLDAILKDSGEI